MHEERERDTVIRVSEINLSHAIRRYLFLLFMPQIFSHLLGDLFYSFHSSFISGFIYRGYRVILSHLYIVWNFLVPLRPYNRLRAPAALKIHAWYLFSKSVHHHTLRL